MNIPKLNHDEYFLGWQGRVRFFNHIPTILSTINDLRTWYDSNHHNVDLCKKGTSLIFILSKASGKPLDEFIRDHTLIPFTYPFGIKLNEKFTQEVALQKFLAGSNIRTHKRGAWFCPECISQDLQSDGISYWRRSHHLLGADWCINHRGKLRLATEKIAFNYEPKCAQASGKWRVVQGADFLDEANPVIQRYVNISNHILNRHNNLELNKITSLLELQYQTQQYIENARTGNCLSSTLKSKAPHNWLMQFLNLNHSSPNYDPFNFKKILSTQGSAQNTEHYVIALSLLFNSSAGAIEQIERTHTSNDYLESSVTESTVNPWCSEQILNKYSYYQGCHNTFAMAHGMENKAVSTALKQHGLPDLGRINLATKKALLDFFNGQSLLDTCKTNDAQLNEVEDLLRFASSRLISGLNNAIYSK